MKRILALAVLLLTLLMAANSIADDLTNGLVAYYPFNGNANDASGNGNNGTVFGATLTSDRFNNANSAYNFDGLNDFIAIPEMLYSSIPSFSISAWVKPVDVSNPLEAVVHIGSIQGQSLLGVNSGLPSMNSKLSNGLWYTAITNSQLNTNEYTNLIASYYKGDRIEIWVNGILKNSTPIPNYDLFIERFHYSSIGDVNFVGNVEYPWKGAIDDVRIYNRALSPSEIGQIAAQTAYQLLISKWNYVGNGNWGEASKWSSGTVPSAFNHQAVIDGNPSGTVSLNTNVFLNSLTVSQYNNLGITDGGSISLKKFNDNSPVVSNDGTIKLSTTPNMSSYASLIADGADATFKGNGNVVLDGGGQSSISSINGGRWINDTTHTITGTGQINGPLENRGTLIASNGTLTINGLVTGNGNVQINDGGILNLQNNLQTGNFSMSQNAALSVGSNYYIDVLKNFSFSQTNENNWGWSSGSYLKMDGGIAQTLEIGGQDKGATAAGFTNNFNLNALSISGTGTRVTLMDAVNNGNRSMAEALYVNNLSISGGNTLDLDGLKLYTMQNGQPQLVKVGDNFGGGNIIDSYTPKTFGLFIGMKDDKTKFRGDLSAELMFNKFFALSNVDKSYTSLFEGDMGGVGINKENIQNSLSIIRSQMRTGDSLFFYISAHGGPYMTVDGQPIGNESVPPSKNINNEIVAIGPRSYQVPYSNYYFKQENIIKDDELASWLSPFQNVNKMVFLDACHSGGFWENLKAQNDHISLLAAAPEEGTTKYINNIIGQFSDLFNGEGWFTIGLAKALSKGSNGYANAEDGKDVSTLTMDEIVAYLKKDYWANFLVSGAQFYEQDFGDQVDFTADMADPVYYKTEDFNGSLSTAPIPHSVWLLGSGLLGLVGWRRFRKV